MRTGRARVETTAPPVAQSGTSAFVGGVGQSSQAVLGVPLSREDSLRDVLGLPQAVVDLILKTTYSVGSMQIPLFGIARSNIDPNTWIYNNQEIQEAIRVYDLMKGAYTGTGTEADPVRHPYSSMPADQTKIRSDEEALAQFAAHISELAVGRVLKIRKNMLVDDDSVFESPALADYRREEILKDTLLNRKRIPIQGKCRRGGCKSTEIYQEEKFIRSGDEGGVWFNTCAKCEHEWKA